MSVALVCEAQMPPKCLRYAYSTFVSGVPFSGVPLSTPRGSFTVDIAWEKGRLTKATELYIDQSLMTGESEPVRKQARQMLYGFTEYHFDRRIRSLPMLARGAPA